MCTLKVYSHHDRNRNFDKNVDKKYEINPASRLHKLMLPDETNAEYKNSEWRFH